MKSDWIQQLASYTGRLVFPSVSDAYSSITYPEISIPLFIKEHPVAIRKPKITEISTVPNVLYGPGSIDTSVQALFFGAPDPLQLALSGWFVTPSRTTSVTMTPELFASTTVNTYDAGQCTYYCWNLRKDLPRTLGNAETWNERAITAGFPVDSTPVTGDIGVVEINDPGQSGSVGHVFYVERVYSNGTLLASEMNNIGVGIVDHRVIPYASDSKMSFIHAKSGTGKRMLQPTVDGTDTGAAIAEFIDMSYGEVVSAYIEGRVNRNSKGCWQRVDPSAYIDPYGRKYMYPIITAFESQYGVTHKKQAFTTTLYLEGK